MTGRLPRLGEEVAVGLHRISRESLEPVSTTTFAALKLRERDDLQRLLRDDLSVLDDSLLLIAEEYGDFAGSQRRIDLLALDRTAQLVVIELKRTTDGGHVELQALRYAAMVSTMTIEQLIDTHARQHALSSEESRRVLEEWVGDEGELVELSSKVRLILASADFSTEITATVLWLTQEYGLDISCYRLVPYLLGTETLLDIQRIIPLPEATDFQIQQRVKGAASAATSATRGGRDFTKYDLRVGDRAFDGVSKQGAVKLLVRALHDGGVPVSAIREGIEGSRWIPVHPQDGETVEQAFRREHPTRKSHYWFDLGIHDDVGSWIIPRFGGTLTEHYLAGLQQLAPPSMPVTWSAVAG
jgi:hypothetical protein